jgi:hypothetical protein
MSSLRHQRPSSVYVPYPAHVLDHTILEALGLIWGTRTDEVPPKVVMTRAHWDQLIAAIHATEKRGKRALEASDAPHRAIAFLGTTWRDNPLIPRPPGESPEETGSRYRYRPRKRSRFAHLTELPVDAAIETAKAEHAHRVTTQQMAEEDSIEVLQDALEAIRRAAANRVEPRPLLAPEGEDPPTPTQIRRGL